jgi:hypothetical protein
VGLMKNCKETSTLVTQSLDRRLNWREQVGMRLHLKVCSNCARFMRQMHLIRAWLHSEENEAGQAGLNDETRARIARKLQEEE